MSPVRKFRTLEEAERALWTAPGGALEERIRAVWHRAALLARPRYPTGVHRFRTLEEAERAKREWRAAGPPRDRE